MSNVPLPEPAAWQVRRNDYGLWESTYFEECSEWEAKNCVAAADLRQLYTADQMHAHAAAVSAAKDAEIAALRAELIKSLADNAALRAEVAGLREFVEHVRRNGGTHLAAMAIAVLAARKGEA